MALTGAAWFVGERWLAEFRMAVVLLAGGTNLIAAWIAFIPIAWVHRHRTSYLPQAAIGAMALRMMLVASVLVVASMVGPWNVWLLATWLLVYYFSLLVVETAFAVLLVRDGKPTSEDSIR